MDPKQLEKDKQCAKKFRASESQNALIYWKIFTSMFRFHNTFMVQTGNEQEAVSIRFHPPKPPWSRGTEME